MVQEDYSHHKITFWGGHKIQKERHEKQFRTFLVVGTLRRERRRSNRWRHFWKNKRRDWAKWTVQSLIEWKDSQCLAVNNKVSMPSPGVVQPFWARAACNLHSLDCPRCHQDNWWIWLINFTVTDRSLLLSSRRQHPRWRWEMSSAVQKFKCCSPMQATRSQ